MGSNNYLFGQKESSLGLLHQPVGGGVDMPSCLHQRLVLRHEKILGVDSLHLIILGLEKVLNFGLGQNLAQDFVACLFDVKTDRVCLGATSLFGLDSDIAGTEAIAYANPVQSRYGSPVAALKLEQLTVGGNIDFRRPFCYISPALPVFGN